eukprot:516840-Rhodomonas_salina.3
MAPIAAPLEAESQHFHAQYASQDALWYRRNIWEGGTCGRSGTAGTGSRPLRTARCLRTHPTRLVPPRSVSSREMCRRTSIAGLDNWYQVCVGRYGTWVVRVDLAPLWREDDIRRVADHAATRKGVVVEGDTEDAEPDEEDEKEVKDVEKEWDRGLERREDRREPREDRELGQREQEAERSERPKRERPAMFRRQRELDPEAQKAQGLKDVEKAARHVTASPAPDPERDRLHRNLDAQAEVHSELHKLCETHVPVAVLVVPYAYGQYHSVLWVGADRYAFGQYRTVRFWAYRAPRTTHVDR